MAPDDDPLDDPIDGMTPEESRRYLTWLHSLMRQLDPAFVRAMIERGTRKTAGK